MFPLLPERPLTSGSGAIFDTRTCKRGGFLIPCCFNFKTSSKWHGTARRGTNPVLRVRLKTSERATHKRTLWLEQKLWEVEHPGVLGCFDLEKEWNTTPETCVHVCEWESVVGTQLHRCGRQRHMTQVEPSHTCCYVKNITYSFSWVTLCSAWFGSCDWAERLWLVLRTEERL